MNKVVIIFGASSGIGLEIAKLFLAAGDTVYNCSRTSANISGIKDIVVDVTNSQEIADAYKTIIKKEKAIDILVYSAGFSMAAPLKYVKSADYRYLFDVNFFGAVEAIKLIIPYMETNGGRIACISSLAAAVPIAYDPYYCAAKAALNMFVTTIQLELRKQKIYVTAIMPGGTKTDFTFKRKVYKADDVNEYQYDFCNAVASLADIEQNGMNPYSVAIDTISVLNMDAPPILYSCGTKNKVYHAIAKIVPATVLSAMVNANNNKKQ